MAREKTTRFLERAEKARNEIDQNRGLFEDAYEYLMPFRNTWSKQNGTHNRNTKQYDSTGMIAAGNFVNTMQSNFTPVFQKWAELKAGPDVPEERRATQNKSLQKISDKLQIYRNASNFATATAEMYFDLGIGTGIMFILEGTPERPFNYVAVPLSEVAIEDGKFGEVCALYRTHRTKGMTVKSLWPRAKISPELAKRIKDKPDDLLEFVEGFYYDYEEFRWYQDVVWTGEKEKRVYEDMYEEAPFVSPRWMKIPGFATGIGPFVMAMADYKTLNKMKELMLMLAALNVFGVYTVANSGTFNPSTIQIKPAAFIPVERNGTQNPSIAPLPRAGSFEIQEYMLNDLKEDIKKVMLDNRLPSEEDPVRTAFEIAERIKKLQVDIGAAFGRLVYEFVLPLHKREISILKKMKLIQVPPDFQVDNFFAQVQVVSPIAQQQAAADVDRYVKAFELTASMSLELAMLTFDVERAGKWIAEKLSVDAELVRENEDKAALQQAVTQLIVQAQQAAAAQQAAPRRAVVA